MVANSGFNLFTGTNPTGMRWELPASTNLLTFVQTGNNNATVEVYIG